MNKIKLILFGILLAMLAFCSACEVKDMSAEVSYGGQKNPTSIENNLSVTGSSNVITVDTSNSKEQQAK